MKKQIVLLFILFTCCLCFSQEAEYKIVSETEIVNKNFEPIVYPRAVGFVSFEQLKNDVSSLKYLLQTSYSGYEDAVQRGFDLEKFEQNILSEFLNSIYDKNSISTDKICYVVYNELKKFIIDSHFTLCSLNSYYSLCIRNRILYSNIYVKQKGEKYFVIESDIPEIKIRSEYTGEKTNLFCIQQRKEKIFIDLDILKHLKISNKKMLKKKFN
jgi:hypothetical protein